jgi:hypothetical protein
MKKAINAYITLITFIITFLILSQGKISAQVKKSNIPFHLNSDTTSWYKQQQKLTNKLSLPDINRLNYPFYFRLWMSNDVLDIWEGADSKISARLIIWTDEHVLNNEAPTSRIFIQPTMFNADTVLMLKNLIIASGILNIPTDDSIPGWKPGFDGVEYIFEYSTADSYSFKTYWAPKAQGALKQALQIDSFISKTRYLANIPAIFKTFVASIPYQCYGKGHAGVCKALTKKEAKKYAAEREHYRLHRLEQSKITQSQ